MEPQAADDTFHEPSGLAKELDELSLVQALRDFEVANARVIDLTQRLVETMAAVTALETALDEQRLAFADLEARHEAMRHSIAFRLASKIWALRNAVRG